MSPGPVEYQVIDPGDGTYTVIRFKSKFRGQWTTWRARIELRPAGSGSYIDVAEPNSDQERDLRIGLPITEVDRATISKVIVMIRQYKKLAPGRHEFGRNA